MPGEGGYFVFFMNSDTICRIWRTHLCFPNIKQEVQKTRYMSLHSPKKWFESLPHCWKYPRPLKCCPDGIWNEASWTLFNIYQLIDTNFIYGRLIEGFLSVSIELAKNVLARYYEQISNGDWKKGPFQMEPFGRGHTTQCIKNNTYIYAAPEKICAFR